MPVTKTGLYVRKAAKNIFFKLFYSENSKHNA